MFNGNERSQDWSAASNNKNQSKTNSNCLEVELYNWTNWLVDWCPWLIQSVLSGRSKRQTPVITVLSKMSLIGFHKCYSSPSLFWALCLIPTELIEIASVSESRSEGSKVEIYKKPLEGTLLDNRKRLLTVEVDGLCRSPPLITPTPNTTPTPSVYFFTFTTKSPFSVNSVGIP